MELRAFCSKHSTSLGGGSAQFTRNLTRTVADDSLVAKPQPVTVLPNKLAKLRLTRKNKEKNTTQAEVTGLVSNEMVKNETSTEQDSLTIKLSRDAGDMKSCKNIDTGVTESDSSLQDISNLIPVVKKVMWALRFLSSENIYYDIIGLIFKLP